MKLSHITLVICLSFAVAFTTVKFLIPSNSKTESAKVSAYDRVMRTGELRCGYGVFAPYFTKDLKTGNFGGIWFDFTEAVAEHLGLKVVWAEEVGPGDIAAALDSRKIDVYCGGLWTAGKRVRVVDFLKPSAYEPILAYVRNTDHRFDNDINLLNDAKIRISTIDGEGGGLAAAEEFPKATMVSLPQMSNYADMFNQVVVGKADVTFAAPSGAAFFIKNNPSTLRPILTQPIRIFPVSLAVPYGEDKLRDLLNQAQDDVIYNGIMEKIIGKYEVNKGDFWRVAKPYTQPTQ